MSFKTKAKVVLKELPLFTLGLMVGLVEALMWVVDGIAEKVSEWLTPYTLLTHDDIQELIRKGYITADSRRVNATSVDVTLDKLIATEVVMNSILESSY